MTARDLLAFLDDNWREVPTLWVNVTCASCGEPVAVRGSRIEHARQKPVREDLESYDHAVRGIKVML